MRRCGSLAMVVAACCFVHGVHAYTQCRTVTTHGESCKSKKSYDRTRLHGEPCRHASQLNLTMCYVHSPNTHSQSAQPGAYVRQRQASMRQYGRARGLAFTPHTTPGKSPGLAHPVLRSCRRAHPLPVLPQTLAAPCRPRLVPMALCRYPPATPCAPASMECAGGRAMPESGSMCSSAAWRWSWGQRLNTRGGEGGLNTRGGVA